MIKQFIPQGFCLKCQACCRFREADSAWAPCLLDEEMQDLLDEDIPAVLISIDKRIVPIPNPAQGEFICPFLNPSDNKCKIYESRPLECQLYPFLINLRGNKVFLTIDLNCPYVKENLKSEKFKEYTEYLSAFLNSPKQVRVLKDNPQVLQAYEEVLNILELKI
jgi:Fe-S-cluster containining protein